MKKALAVLALVLASGCASSGGGAGAAAPAQSLLSAIGTAQALQHESDEHEANGRIPEALAAARRILDVPFPTGAAEREDVRLDAHGRIAELELARDDDRAAETAADAGLAEASRDSYFRARLHVVLGRVHQARAARLRDEGEATLARAESEAAIDELERSITINRAVLGLGPSLAPGDAP